MIRKYHNHKLQTAPWHREEEPLNHHETPGKDWRMLFNVKKCKVLHIGHNNAYCNYSMNGEILQSVTEETGLGIIVSNDLKPSKQYVSAIKTATMTLEND